MLAHRLPLEVHTNCASYFRAEDLFRLCRCSAVHRDRYQTAAYDDFLVELFVVDADYFKNSLHALTAYSVPIPA